MPKTLFLLLLFFFLLTPLSFARHKSGSHSHHSNYHYTFHRSTYHHSTSHRSLSHKTKSYSARSYRTKSYSYKSHPRSHKSSYCSSCPRDIHGRINRSTIARKEFMKQTGYPHGRKGYVIDHVPPLKKGGSDSPSNMQWQTKEAAKAKDKWE